MSTAVRNARLTDPVTSHMAAEDNATRATHRLMLLKAYEAAADGLNADEAGEVSGVIHISSGPWKRVSELRRDGMVEYHGGRPGKSGRLQRVDVLSEAGRALLEKMWA